MEHVSLIILGLGKSFLELYPEEEEETESEYTWTTPKVLGIAAGGLCVIALIGLE